MDEAGVGRLRDLGREPPIGGHDNRALPLSEGEVEAIIGRMIEVEGDRQADRGAKPGKGTSRS